MALARARLARELTATQQLGLASLLQGETAAAGIPQLMPQLSMAASAPQISAINGPGSHPQLFSSGALLAGSTAAGASPATLLASSSLGDMGASASAALLQKLLSSQLASVAQQQSPLLVPASQASLCVP